MSRPARDVGPAPDPQRRIAPFLTWRRPCAENGARLRAVTWSVRGWRGHDTSGERAGTRALVATHRRGEPATAVGVPGFEPGISWSPTRCPGPDWATPRSGRGGVLRAHRHYRVEAPHPTCLTGAAACSQNRPAQVKQRSAVRAASAASAVVGDADDEYLTTEEVARRLRVHPTTILRRLGAMGDADPKRIPAVRVGRVWRIPRREFEEWLTRSGAASSASGRQRRLF